MPSRLTRTNLAQIYAFDTAFFDLAGQISNGLDNVEAAIGSDGLKAAIRNVNTLARQVGETYDRRYQVITGSGAPQ